MLFFFSCISLKEWAYLGVSTSASVLYYYCLRFQEEFLFSVFLCKKKKKKENKKKIENKLTYSTVYHDVNIKIKFIAIVLFHCSKAFILK